MVGIIKLRVIEARQLPVMDKASNLTDAYVEVRFHDFNPLRTEIARKSLSPVWNQEFRLDIADSLILHDEPLQLLVYDHDVLNDDMIGVVLIDLHPLLRASTNEISGWFPIFDPLGGVRGELSVVVKLQFLDELSTMAASPMSAAYSANSIPFFDSPCIPHGYDLAAVCGFLEEILIDDDPEHAWVDSFRSSRSSNLARMNCLHSLSGKIRREIGHKARELGANAVVGFIEHFDFETRNGIVIRGYGTACVLAPAHPLSHSGSMLSRTHTGANSPTAALAARRSESPVPSPGTSFDANKVSASLESEASFGSKSRLRNKRKKHKRSFDSGDVRLLTLFSLPPNIVRRIGGIVSAKSVKLLSDSAGKRESVIAQHDSWWQELRHEVRAHAKRLNCKYVMAYRETTSISGDVALLSAYGTAVVLDDGAVPCSVDHVEPSLPSSGSFLKQRSSCSICHLPFALRKAPFPVKRVSCGCCGRRFVHDLLLSSAEAPPELETVGVGRYIQARVCRALRGADEDHASSVSEALPFLEYQLYQALLLKLKVQAVNCAFNLKIDLAVCGEYIAGTATCTGVFAAAMPPPPAVLIRRNSGGDPTVEGAFLATQRQIEDMSDRNRTSFVSLRNFFQEQQNVSTNVSRRSSPSVPIGEARDAMAFAEQASSSGESSGSESSVSLSDDPEDVHQGSATEAEAEAAIEDEDHGKRRRKAPRRRRIPVVEEEDVADEPFVLEVDDYVDQDMTFAVVEMPNPSGMRTASSKITLGPVFPGSSIANMQHVFVMRRYDWDDIDLSRLNQLFSSAHQDALNSLFYSASCFQPCRIVGIDTSFEFLEQRKELQVILTCSVEADSALQPDVHDTSSAPIVVPDDDMLFHMDGTPARRSSDGDSVGLHSPPSSRLLRSGEPASLERTLSPGGSSSISDDAGSVLITSLGVIPGTVIRQNLARLSVHIIRESDDLSKFSVNGFGGFAYSVMAEAEAIMRAHVASIGGNALIHADIQKFMFDDNETNAEAYCFVSMSGDAVTADIRHASATKDDILAQIWEHGVRQRSKIE
jgi:uncharacterized protein YbjQ (UPF0145 family)